MRLYSYFRSSAAYRVRIALNLKGIAPEETVYVNLKTGEHMQSAYGSINPAHAVPALVVEETGGTPATTAFSPGLDPGDQAGAQPMSAEALAKVDARRLSTNSTTLTQSLAILEWLEETHPEPPLLPKTPEDRARVRALSQLVACDIHPLNNLRVLKYITGELNATEEQKTAWIHHWIHAGFRALEQQLASSPHTGTYCHGDIPGMADCCLIPQVYNAERFGVDLSPYPTIQRINAACLRTPAFDAASPQKQPDCVL